MNDDGSIGANDAVLILRQVVGLAPDKSDSIAVREPITIALSDISGAAGDIITLPVQVDDSHDLAGGELVISYDETVLRPAGISPNPDALFVSNINESGIIRIAFAGSDSLNSETIAQMKFEVLSDSTSPIRLELAKLFRRDAFPVDSRTVNGRFRSWAMPPEQTQLLQNFPNPFNPDTWIPYQLSESAPVLIRIYSTSGQLVRTLDLGYRDAGVYKSRSRAIYWDGRNEAGEEISSGVYFYSIQAGEFTATRKMMVTQ